MPFSIIRVPYANQKFKYFMLKRPKKHTLHVRGQEIITQ